MNTFHIKQTLWAVFFFIFAGTSMLHAQGKVVVKSEKESFSQATYYIASANKEAKVTIRKQSGKVQVRLESKNGTILGTATVENDGNGNPLISIHEARTGTHKFWEFALDRIIPDGNGVSLSPRAKAYLKCKDKCKDFVKSHPGWQILTVSNGNQAIAVAKLSQIKKAFAAYQKCMWKCIREARSRYQQR